MARRFTGQIIGGLTWTITGTAIARDEALATRRDFLRLRSEFHDAVQATRRLRARLQAEREARTNASDAGLAASSRLRCGHP
jgi:hypothetical protein